MKQFSLFILLLSLVCSNAQHQENVDFLHADIFIEPIPKKKQINGTVIYEFEVLKDIDSVFLDAKNMAFSQVLLNGKNVKFSNNKRIITINRAFKGGKKYKLKLKYACTPKQTVYFLGWDDRIEGNEQIWTQGQGKYTSHWLPSFDDMEEKVEFDLTVYAPLHFTVAANGLAVDASDTEDETIYLFDMQKPMSSYLLAFAIGNYNTQELTSKSGIPIENYYYPQDSLKVEPTYRYTKEIFDFLEDEIGVPYPWQNYKQIPVRDFLYAGMENTGTTIFSDGFVIDSTAFVDKNYVNVNAHEMAHQWFGNLVTEKDGNHHWLHEGFATYYAYLAEKSLFGDDHFYWKLYTSLQQLKDQEDRGEGASLIDPKASSLIFYEKGAWALFMLHNKIGEEAFKKGIKTYLTTYRFGTVTVQDFLKEMETASGTDLKDFQREWLENIALPFEAAKDKLANMSTSVKKLLDFEMESVQTNSDTIGYLKYWQSTTSIHLKKQLLKMLKEPVLFDVMLLALESDTIPLRQSVLEILPTKDFLPKELIVDLLGDNSYITKELALFNLWQTYPKERSKYLDSTKHLVGLPNKNIRLMWLTLAMLTQGYDSSKTKAYFEELSNYTNPAYSFEICQGAFFYIKEVFGYNDESLTSLILATEHHAWQFRKFARSLLDELLQDTDYKNRIEGLSKELKPEEIRYLKSKLVSE